MRMPKYELTFEAEKDLLGIAHYTIKTWGEDQARVYHAALKKAFSTIGTDPSKGRIFSKKRSELRFLRAEHHYIFYLIEESNVPLILAVLHENMDLVKRIKRRLDG